MKYETYIHGFFPHFHPWFEGKPEMVAAGKVTMPMTRTAKVRKIPTQKTLPQSSSKLG